VSSALVVIIDGCNEDYVNRAAMPFVEGLKRRGSYVAMESTPGFDHRPALFTGLSARTTNSFVAFCFKPRVFYRGLYRWLRPPLTWHTGWPQIGPLVSLLGYLRTGVWSKSDDISLLTAAYYAITNTWVDFGCIPLVLLPHVAVDRSLLCYQRMERERSHDHLFGILRESGVEMHFLYNKAERMADSALGTAGLSGRPAVWILHYGESDSVGHQFGPNSQQMSATLRNIDSSIRDVYTAMQREVDFLLLLSDHGMIEVEADIDVWGALQSLDAEIVRDYLVFLNSPLARFWFRTAQAEREVRQVLDRFQGFGRVVSKDEMAARGVPTDDRYGEVIFWTRPGVNIWPNFYHRRPVRGMHTYFDHTDVVPLLLHHREARWGLADPASLIDVTPTLLDLLGIAIPPMDGRSVLVRS